jgi:Bacterial Ig domain
MPTLLRSTHLVVWPFSAALGLALLAGPGTAAADTDTGGSAASHTKSSASSPAAKKRPSVVRAAKAEVGAPKSAASPGVRRPSATATARAGVKVVRAPIAPVAPLPNVADVIGWLGTETRKFLFNHKPTVNPTQLAQESASGMVAGTLNTVDPEADPVKYRVLAGPLHGTVAINPDGRYLYTPTEEFATTGGVDVFAVKVTDVGWGLHLFTGGRSLVVPVAVTVIPSSGYQEPSFTRSFYVYNQSSGDIVYTGTSGGDLHNAPAVGSSIAPGDKLKFDVTDYPLGYNQPTVTFSAADGTVYTGGFYVPSYWDKTRTQCTGSCTPSSWTDGDNIYLQNAPVARLT